MRGGISGLQHYGRCLDRAGLTRVVVHRSTQRAAAALAAWDREHPKPVVTLSQVADHIDHVRQVAGIDHVGLGSDFDGIPDTPVGLEGVDCYPALLVELMRRGWTDSDIAKLAGENLLRVMATAERVGDQLRKATVR